MELLTQLDAPYKLVAEQVAFYPENGFAHPGSLLCGRLMLFEQWCT
jgi:hypothetical protein